MLIGWLESDQPAVITFERPKKHYNRASRVKIRPRFGKLKGVI